jgi:DNA-binding phage protein
VVARILQERIDRGGTPLRTVADFAGVDRCYLREVLAGRRNPTIAWLEKVALALDLPVAALFEEGSVPAAPASAADPRPPSPTFACRLRRAAATEGSMAALVDATGCSAAHVYRLLRAGTGKLRLDTVDRMARALGCRAGDLVE